MVIIDGLKGLSDPKRTEIDIDISQLTPTLVRELLEQMCSIRIAERKLAKAKEQGIIGGPVHLGVGQEASSVGVAAHLRSTDRVFGAHRSHAHILSLKMDFRALFAEVLGRVTGFSKGMGGSMHLWHQPSGFYGSVPIVSGTVPLAVGAGLAAKLQKTGDVAIAFFGDGAVEEGVVHESLNLAKIQNIPVIFVVENNLFASHMHISMRQPNTSTARFAHANDIACAVVDGNDVANVAGAAEELIRSAREGEGPGFIELVTYRWYGHVDWREDIDVGVNRSKEDLDHWKMLDPISRLKRAMIDKGLLSETCFKGIEASIQKISDAAWEDALHDPYPDSEALGSHVYSMGR